MQAMCLQFGVTCRQVCIQSKHSAPSLRVQMGQLSAFLTCLLAMIQQMLRAARTLLDICGGSRSRAGSSNTAGEGDARSSSSTEADSSGSGGGGGSSGAADSANASGSGSGGGVSPAIVRQLRVAQVAAAAVVLTVRSMIQSLERATGVPHQMATRLQRVWMEGSLQREVGQLAAALQAAWAEPAPMAHEEVEAAEMAAGSSCAYLRCSNLGGDGGLAAGQGVGSKRCRCGGQGWAVACMGAEWMAVASRWVLDHDCCYRNSSHLAVPAPIHVMPQRMPRGVVLWHRLLARRLAAGRAQAHVQGAGGVAAAGQGAKGGRAAGVNHVERVM